MSTLDMSFEPISTPILDPDDPPCVLPYESYDDSFIDSRNPPRHQRHGNREGHKSNQKKSVDGPYNKNKPSTLPAIILKINHQA